MNEAEKLRDEALRLVTLPPENQYWDCLEWAYRWVKARQYGDTFTSGEVSQDYPGAPAEGRVWGAVMNQLRRDGLVESTKRYERHPSATRHCAPALVWVKIRK